jgi:hypothetical protein
MLAPRLSHTFAPPGAIPASASFARRISSRARTFLGDRRHRTAKTRQGDQALCHYKKKSEKPAARSQTWTALRNVKPPSSCAS